MSKRKISAKEAVADIRAGMDDCELMVKYQVTVGGLRSLFDKLVLAGAIDVAEIQGRVPGFLGTVTIENAFDPSPPPRATRDLDPKPIQGSVRINAQEAARDIRLAATDCALMEKHGLSHAGLQSLFTKLLTGGFITQEDLDRRNMGIDETVDLKEESLTLSAVFNRFGPEKSLRSITYGGAACAQPVETPRSESRTESRAPKQNGRDLTGHRGDHDAQFSRPGPSGSRSLGFGLAAAVVFVAGVLMLITYFGKF